MGLVKCALCKRSIPNHWIRAHVEECSRDIFSVSSQENTSNNGEGTSTTIFSTAETMVSTLDCNSLGFLEEDSENTPWFTESDELLDHSDNILSRTLLKMHEIMISREGPEKIKSISFFCENPAVSMNLMEKITKYRGSMKIKFKSVYQSISKLLLKDILLERKVVVSEPATINGWKGLLSFSATVSIIHPEFLIRLLLATPRNEEFHVEPCYSSEICGFYSGDVFRSCFAQCSKDEIPLLLGVYSDGTQCTRHGRGLHPISICICNVDQPSSIVITFIPTPQLLFRVGSSTEVVTEAQVSDVTYRACKRAYFSTIFRELLNLLPNQPFQAYLSGVGNRTFRSTLGIIRGDIPELHSIFNLRNAITNCRFCGDGSRVRLSDLSEESLQPHEQATEFGPLIKRDFLKREIERIIDLSHQHGRVTEARNHAKSLGIHLDGINIFTGISLPKDLDPRLISGIDMLHTLCGTLFHILKLIMTLVVTETNGKQNDLDFVKNTWMSLGAPPQVCELPTSLSGYSKLVFPSLISLLPTLLLTKALSRHLAPKVCHLVATWISITVELKTSNFRREALPGLLKLIEQGVMLYHQVWEFAHPELSQNQPTIHFPKAHLMLHLASYISLMGGVNEMDTIANEQDHKLVKLLFSKTNKDKIKSEGQILRRIAMSQLLKHFGNIHKPSFNPLVPALLERRFQFSKGSKSAIGPLTALSAASVITKKLRGCWDSEGIDLLEFEDFLNSKNRSTFFLV
jgi:hypothetical protein